MPPKQWQGVGWEPDLYLSDPPPPIRSRIYFIQCLNPNPGKGKVSSPGTWPRALPTGLPSSPLPLTPPLPGSVPRPQLPSLFDVGHVAEQLRQAGVLEAVCARSAHFPVRLPFQSFLAR